MTAALQVIANTLEAISENKCCNLVNATNLTQLLYASVQTFPDADLNTDRHQNLTIWFPSHTQTVQIISPKSVHNFLRNLADKQTERQTDKRTDRPENMTFFFGVGKNTAAFFNKV